MKKRLKVLVPAILAIAMVSAAVPTESVEHHGWIEIEKSEQALEAPDIKSGKGKIRLLYKEWAQAAGYEYITRRQLAPDCVGQSVATAVDMRLAVQALEGPYQTPQYMADPSSIYGLSRVEISNATYPRGTTVEYGMRALSEYGVLFQKNYLYIGYDLSAYDPDYSVTWGRVGLPSILEQVAKKTPLVDYYKVLNYEAVRDAIASGYPVVVGSSVGFRNRRFFFRGGSGDSTRDENGFLKPRGTWYHAMCFVGVDDKSGRKGVCCQNSWGPDWVSGGTKLGQPKGSFWIDARTVTKMVSQNDAYAIVQIKSRLNYRFSL